MTVGTSNDDARAVGVLRVSVLDDEVVLNDFHETDSEVVSLARQAGDADAVVHTALQVGARTIKLTQVSQDTQVVETAFGKLERRFQDQLHDALTQISETTAELFGEKDGTVPREFAHFRQELDDSLAGAFDPASKKSIIGKFDELIRDLGNEERNAIRDLLDPGNERSPLLRLQRDLSQAVRDEADSTQELVRELSEKIAVSQKEHSDLKRMAEKGRFFEDTVHSYVCQLVDPFGDTAERTGDETGCMGSRGRRSCHSQPRRHERRRAALHLGGKGPEARPQGDTRGTGRGDGQPRSRRQHRSI